jgi:sugar lactone lactonase YvrE
MDTDVKGKQMTDSNCKKDVAVPAAVSRLSHRLRLGSLLTVTAAALVFVACPSPISLTPPLGSAASTMAATPTFSPAGGMYTTDQNVTISSATSGATIYYTTDGTVPSTSSPKFTGPVAVTGNGTYKVILAMAVATGSSNSGLAAATFKISHPITTFAGTGVYGFSGDAAASTLAKLSYPAGLAVDNTAGANAGNIYVADTANMRIRMVTPSGTISTVAGTGTQGALGDGAAATAAQLNYPSGIAVDSAGAIYVADSYNHKIRRFTVGGNITTVAGTGTAGALGDGGLATAAQLNYPSGVAVDSLGNVYVADSSNQKIRKFTVGGNISTYAGTGNITNGTTDLLGDGGAAASATFNYPYGVAVDAAGNLYIADNGNYRIREVTKATGIISTVAGGGKLSLQDGQPATSINLAANISGYTGNPGSVITDNAGNVYFTSAYYMVHKIDSAGTLWNVAGGNYTALGDNGPAVSAMLNLGFGPPYGAGIAINNTTGSLYISDTWDYRVRKVQ